MRRPNAPALGRYRGQDVVRWFRLLALAVLAGCSGASGSPSPTDPEMARMALFQALDAWREGQAPGELAKVGSPPTFVIDEDWQRGKKLLRFDAAAGAGEPHGAALRFPIELAFQNPKGKPIRKRVVYEVGIDSTISIVRLD